MYGIRPYVCITRRFAGGQVWAKGCILQADVVREGALRVLGVSRGSLPHRYVYFHQVRIYGIKAIKISCLHTTVNVCLFKLLRSIVTHEVYIGSLSGGARESSILYCTLFPVGRSWGRKISAVPLLQQHCAQRECCGYSGAHWYAERVWRLREWLHYCEAQRKQVRHTLRL